MTISLETELVGSSYDATRKVCHYTIERDGKRWTASVNIADLHKCGANKQAKRNLVANALALKMQGPADE